MWPGGELPVCRPGQQETGCGGVAVIQGPGRSACSVVETGYRGQELAQVGGETQGGWERRRRTGQRVSGGQPGGGEPLIDRALRCGRGRPVSKGPSRLRKRF